MNWRSVVRHWGQQEKGSRKRSREMNTGIYYNNITKEITSVTNSDLLSEAGWRQLTDDPQLGLLAVRALLVDRGLVDEDTTVYWHLPQPDQAGGPALVCAQTETEKKTGGRLSRLWSNLRGGHQRQLPTSSAKGSV